ncbi:permease for cytosine/purines, uracil, thiamine, allantoin-domain-containing protein [Xylariales sp. PMI_506]|nr:permease for cytosine/purines, uracil, thiamine, allantoin-domain-containing protein [Xylariales sp. PMI_506]
MGLLDNIPRPRLPRTFQSLQVSNDSNEDNRWANRDILPVPKEEQTYKFRAYFGYWAAVGANVTPWSLGSSNLANGLDAGGTIGGVFVGSILCAIVATLCGEAGIRYHLGFPMMSRATFGMYGAYFVIMLKLFVNFIFFGIQSYWGGLAFTVILSSIFPSFQHMENTIPASSGISTQQLIGFICYIIIFTSMMFIHPTRLQPFIYITQAMAMVTMVGLFIWAMSSNHGADFLAPSTTISASDRSFRILQAMSSVAGSWTGAAIRQSDWTRFTTSRKAVWWNQIVTGPIVCVIFCTLGFATTSAVKSMYGTAIWNPITLLQTILQRDYSATSRAGCFFAGVGFFASQVVINLVQNSVSCGMDLASFYPKYIDVTRGSLIMCVVGYLIQPWRFVNQAGLFISVLNSFGMFVAPLAGINAVDFWAVRRLRWKVPDLYKGDSGSIYWYTYGVNFRAICSWALVVWPSFPGFLVAMGGVKGLDVAWTRLFQVTWITGFCGGALVYFLICLVFPPPGKPYALEYLEGPDVLEGFPVNSADVEGAKTASSDIVDVEKTAQ